MFLRRHKSELIYRKPEGISRSAALICPSDLHNWHEYLTNYFTKHDLLSILNDPSRIGNFDETYFNYFVAPKKSVGIKGKSHYLQPGNNGLTKDTVSIGFAVMADGYYIKPFLIMKGQRDTIHNWPSNIAHIYTKSGYMRSEAFMTYLEDVFYRGLN